MKYSIILLLLSFSIYSIDLDQVLDSSVDFITSSEVSGAATAASALELLSNTKYGTNIIDNAVHKTKKMLSSQYRREQEFTNTLNVLAAINELKKSQSLDESNYDQILINVINKNYYGRKALNLMKSARREIDYSIMFYPLYSNEFQLEALRLLLEYKISDMDEKMAGILSFDNPKAIQFLELMLEDGRAIGRTIFNIAQVSTDREVKLLKNKMKNDEEVRSNMPKILEKGRGDISKIKLNPFAQKAKDIMIKKGIAWDESIQLFQHFSNNIQVKSLELILMYKSKEIYKFIPGLLNFNHKANYEALKIALEYDNNFYHFGKFYTETMFSLSLFEYEQQLKKLRSVMKDKNSWRYMKWALVEGQKEFNTMCSKIMSTTFKIY